MINNGVVPELSPEQIEAILDNARRPTRTVQVCRRLDLVEAYEELERRLREVLLAHTERPKGSESIEDLAPEEDPAALDIAAQMEALREQMLGATIPFKFQAVSDRRWHEMLVKHPPRRNDDGTVVSFDARLGINTETFFRALIPESCVYPKLPESRWEKLLGDGDEALTTAQVNDMAEAILAMNRGDSQVPLSRVASSIVRRSAQE